jgi:hypothetical protein
MTMSRKQYREVASILESQIASAEYLPESSAAVRMTTSRIAKDLADMFKRDNSRFRYDTFFEAAGLDGFGDVKKD